MKTLSLSQTIGAAATALLVAIVIPVTALGDTTDCQVATYGQPPICCHVSSHWNGKEIVRTVSFSGYPRTPQDLVTDFYNIRGIPGQNGQIEDRGKSYEFTGSPVISVQACRRRGALMRHTTCTSWVTFKVY